MQSEKPLNSRLQNVIKQFAVKWGTTPFWELRLPVGSS